MLHQEQQNKSFVDIEESLMSRSFQGVRITDGTQQAFIDKAMSTYLNPAAGANYNLPNLMGDQSILTSSQKK